MCQLSSIQNHPEQIQFWAFPCVSNGFGMAVNKSAQIPPNTERPVVISQAAGKTQQIWGICRMEWGNVRGMIYGGRWANQTRHSNDWALPTAASGIGMAKRWRANGQAFGHLTKSLLALSPNRLLLNPSLDPSHQNSPTSPK